MSLKRKAAGVGIVILAIALLVSGMYGLAGLGSHRAPSDYTGYVVDVEVDRGVLFRTTQANVKTHPRSSKFETFCVREADEDKFLGTLKKAMNSQKRVRIEYSRPLYVSIGACEPDTSVIQDIVIVNNSSEGSA